MEIDSTKANSIIDNAVADMTIAHGSGSMDSSQEPSMQGEKEKTTTTFDDDATTTAHGRSTTELAQNQGRKEKRGRLTPIDDASKSVGDEI